MKLKHFGEVSEIRPNAYLIECTHTSVCDREFIRQECKFFALPHPSGLGEFTTEDNVLIDCHVIVYKYNFRKSGEQCHVKFRWPSYFVRTLKAKYLIALDSVSRIRLKFRIRPNLEYKERHIF